MSIMRGADTNCDSKLSHTEMTSAIRAFFADADTAKQNAIDQAALSAGLSCALRPGGPGPFGRGDRGGGGWRGRGGGVFDSSAQWARAIFSVVDTEKTGRITLSQLLAAADRAFAAADKKKAGKLGDAELLDLLDTLAVSAPPAPVASSDQ